MRHSVVVLAAAMFAALVSIPAWGFEMIWSRPVDALPTENILPDWDMTGDGVSEVVITTSQNTAERPLVVLDRSGGVLWTYCPSTTDVCSDCPPADPVSFALVKFADIMPESGKEALIVWEVTNGARGFAVIAPSSSEVLVSVRLGELYSPTIYACEDFGGNSWCEVFVRDWSPDGWEVQLWGIPEPSDLGIGRISNPTTYGIIGNATPSPEIRVTPAEFGQVDCQLVAVDGRSVRKLFSGEMSASEHLLRWDGLDDAGNLVPSGVYFARVTTSSGVNTVKLVLAR